MLYLVGISDFYAPNTNNVKANRVWMRTEEIFDVLHQCFSLSYADRTTSLLSLLLIDPNMAFPLNKIEIDRAHTIFSMILIELYAMLNIITRITDYCFRHSCCAEKRFATYAKFISRFN
jgi:hypothetical protein